MLTLWTMHEAMESAARHIKIALQHPSRSLIANRHQISNSLRDIASQTLLKRRDLIDIRPLIEMPTPILVIDDPAYAPSMFFEGLTYASKRLRDALALSVDVIHCRKADMCGCVEPARSAGYSTFEPLHIGDPIDREHSDGEWLETIEPDGSTGRMWMPAGGPTRPAPRVALHHGFSVPAPVFRLSYSGELVVTDEIAERVLRAGFTDITFIKLGQERGQTETVCKLL